LAGLGFTQASKIEIKTSADDFLLPSDPLRQEYDPFRDQFGRDDRLIIAIETADIFEPSFLERLRDLH
jgi:predicted RND superfamily exporter protein